MRREELKLFLTERNSRIIEAPSSFITLYTVAEPLYRVGEDFKYPLINYTRIYNALENINRGYIVPTVEITGKETTEPKCANYSMVIEFDKRFYGVFGQRQRSVDEILRMQRELLTRSITYLTVHDEDGASVCDYIGAAPTMDVTVSELEACKYWNDNAYQLLHFEFNKEALVLDFVEKKSAAKELRLGRRIKIPRGQQNVEIVQRDKDGVKLHHSSVSTEQAVIYLDGVDTPLPLPKSTCYIQASAKEIEDALKKAPSPTFEEVEAIVTKRGANISKRKQLEFRNRVAQKSNWWKEIFYYCDDLANNNTQYHQEVLTAAKSKGRPIKRRPTGLSRIEQHEFPRMLCELGNLDTALCKETPGN